MVRLHHENMFDLELTSIITGVCFSVSFLLLVLIVQLARSMFYRWGCCCNDSVSPRSRRVMKMLEAVETYRNQQMEWLRESYSAQVRKFES